jgi:hypothetical protein
MKNVMAAASQKLRLEPSSTMARKGPTSGKSSMLKEIGQLRTVETH